jgi:hypothetical protein
VSTSIKFCDTQLLLGDVVVGARNVPLGFRQMLKLDRAIHALPSLQMQAGARWGLSATDAYGRALAGDASNVSDVIEFEAKSSQGFKNKGPPPLPDSLIEIALWGRSGVRVVSPTPKSDSII